MVETVDISDGVVYLNGDNFASDVIRTCPIQMSQIVQNPQATWLTFDLDLMNELVDKKGKVIIEHISNLRKQQKDEEAIDLSDAFFQSFTPLMNILIEQNNYYQVSNIWFWLISKIRKVEKSCGIEFGKGVHKGTAYHFLAFSQMMVRDIDGAYMSFAEAAKEDEIFPKSVLERHEKGLPPSVKVLLLDLGKQNFAYGLVKQIRDTINGWESTHTDISQGQSVVDALRSAIEKGKIPREIAIHFNYSLTKAFMVDLWKKGIVRPTFLTITQIGDSILRFARILEDFIRFIGGLDPSKKVFNYCHGTWFSNENWQQVPSYENDIESLIDDFIDNKWNLSKGGRNLLFTLKIRNVLAHRIPDSPKLFENYIEIILAISSSFVFFCDKQI